MARGRHEIVGCLTIASKEECHENPDGFDACMRHDLRGCPRNCSAEGGELPVSRLRRTFGVRYAVQNWTGTAFGERQVRQAGRWDVFPQRTHLAHDLAVPERSVSRLRARGDHVVVEGTTAPPQPERSEWALIFFRIRATDLIFQKDRNGSRVLYYWHAEIRHIVKRITYTCRKYGFWGHSRLGTPPPTGMSPDNKGFYGRLP